MPTVQSQQLVSFPSHSAATAMPMFASIAFIFYEYIITFTEEVELFWRRGSSGATFLFMTNRYLVLAINIVSISGFASLSEKV